MTTATIDAAETLPRWDLDSIFPGPESPEFREALAGIASATKDLEHLFDREGIGMRSAPIVGGSHGRDRRKCHRPLQCFARSGHAARRLSRLPGRRRRAGMKPLKRGWRMATSSWPTWPVWRPGSSAGSARSTSMRIASLAHASLVNNDAPDVAPASNGRRTPHGLRARKISRPLSVRLAHQPGWRCVKSSWPWRRPASSSTAWSRRFR